MSNNISLTDAQQYKHMGNLQKKLSKRLDIPLDDFLVMMHKNGDLTIILEKWEYIAPIKDELERFWKCEKAEIKATGGTISLWRFLK
jgi:hypothetical protein